jgi:hypothetical protein
MIIYNIGCFVSNQTQGEPVAKKSDKLAQIDREKLLMRLISSGLSRKEVCLKVAEKFGLSPRSIERQYYQVVGELAGQSEAQKTELRGTIQARLDEIYRQTMDAGKFREAISVCELQAKVGGLYDKAQGPDIEMVRWIEAEVVDFSSPKAIEGESDDNGES